MSSILEITEPILRINEPISRNEGIDKYEYSECEPVAGTNLNNSGGAIRLVIKTQDIFTHPSESFLIIEGRLTKGDGTDNGNNDLVSLTNNAMMYLFKDIQYELSGHEIENNENRPNDYDVRSVKYRDDFFKSTKADAVAQNAGWNLRRLYIINNDVNPKGSFSFKIPLKHIFGFCEDYDKVVYGFKHSIILTGNDAIFVNDGVDGGGNRIYPNGKITLSKISWFMPDVIPSIKDMMELYKIIERKEKITVGCRMIQSTNASIPLPKYHVLS